MRDTDQRLGQIEAVARSEPLGSRIFYIHHGCLGFGAAAGALLFGIWALLGIYLAYLVLFVLEKLVANKAVERRDSGYLPFVLALLFLRASAYDVMAVLVWTFEGSIFKMGTLAMVTASTLNIMINQVAYRSTMACVAIPNFLVFVAISALIYAESGPSIEFVASIIAIGCILPFFVLSLARAQHRWLEHEQTKQELQSTQRLESMGKVASGVSHDFNNLLSVVSGSLELLELTDDEAERKELTRTALRAIEQGSGLTKQMLAMGGRSPLVPSPTDLNNAIAEFEAFAVRVIPANIEVVVQSSSRNPIANVDSGMLQNAMLNLALNAKSAMPDGGKLTIVSDIAQAPNGFPASSLVNGECAVIVLSDTGVGIKESVLQQVYEPFFTTREVGQGSGLGLSMVKGFAEQSGGSIQIESAVGVGTTVSIFLPLSLDASSAADVQTFRAEERMGKGPNDRVLVVDDNPQLLDLMTKKLERDGYDVIATSTGDEAVGLLNEGERIGVVVSDLVMPGKAQGTDVLRCAKTLSDPLPVILISGYADVRSAIEDQLRSADRFLEKPVVLAQLSAEVGELLSRRDRVSSSRNSIQ